VDRDQLLDALSKFAKTLPSLDAANDKYVVELGIFYFYLGFVKKN
jgi:hypothetical protein